MSSSVLKQPQTALRTTEFEIVVYHIVLSIPRCSTLCFLKRTGYGSGPLKVHRNRDEGGALWLGQALGNMAQKLVGGLVLCIGKRSESETTRRPPSVPVGAVRITCNRKGR